MNKKLIVKVLLFSSMCGVVGLTQAANQVLILNENTRLKASISRERLNRLMVIGDRIQNVFGDEGAFTLQADEQQGQVFIKPTLENGHAPLALTLITENGLTQDLDLVPDAEESSTLILKPAIQNEKPSFEASSSAFHGMPSNKMQRWIEMMRAVVLRELTPQQKPTPASRTHKPFRVHHEATYVKEDLKVERFRVHNKTKKTQPLLERDFYQAGDLALSLQKTTLLPGEHTILYVVRALS